MKTVRLVCLNCKREFERPQWEVNRGRNKYCSHECAHAGQIGSIRPQEWRREERVCPICKEKFIVGGRAGSRKQKYCSLRCKALARYTNPTIRELSQLEAVYIAGLFDGEGSIILYDRKKGGRLNLRCNIANTYLPVLEWIKEITGTGSIIHQEHPEAPSHKESHWWQCGGQNAVKFLEMLLPYLKIKHDKAIEAIQSQIVKEFVVNE